jgi:hypothetical protein
MKKQVVKYIQRQNLQLHYGMHQALVDGFFVVIPAYLENSTLPFTIESLYQAKREHIRVNVIIVVNDSDADSEMAHHQTLQLFDWCKQKAVELNDSSFRVIPIDAFRLDAREKGAGLARKIGMDQAVIYCASHEIDDAIIVSLDADTLVASNYFEAIDRYFKNSQRLACSIYFEHHFEANLPNECWQIIKLYELHLRYYKQALKLAGFPYSYHTFGSAIACRLSAYVGAGGMTRKQAGEDFYFIHKLVKLGGFGELNTTTVYPSSRPSVRVVFGTGATVQKWLDDNLAVYETYNLQSFIDLAELFKAVDDFFQLGRDAYEKRILDLPGRVRSFLVNQNFYDELAPVIGHCTSVKVFKKRFFEVFNAFRIIKYLNYVHEHFLAKTDVLEAAPKLLEVNGLLSNVFADEDELLSIYRQIDRNETVLQNLR